MKVGYLVAGLALLAIIALAAPTITLSSTSVVAGSSITISITGTNAEKCGIEIVDPAGAKVFVKEITLSAGSGATSWDVPLTARLGTYTVYVTCEISGASTAQFTVTALVGGEARKDFAPLLLTALSALAVVLAAALIARKLL